MPETAVAPAPAAASSPAPAAAPSSAPVAAPTAPASSSPAPVVREIGTSGVKSAVDPHDPHFVPGSDDYVKALLAEKLAPTPTEETAPIEGTVAEPAAPEIAPVEVATPDAEIKPTEAPVKEEDFDLEPEAIVTPEALTQMVTDNPEFGKLLEADPKLKGQLYKTAREAAELKPYREIFPDLESAKSAVQRASTFNDVDAAVLAATTKEGADVALGKIAELCYEYDDQGNLVMDNGRPVIGGHFHGLIDRAVEHDLTFRRDEVKARIEANQYHVGANSQEEANAAYDADHQRLAHFDEMLGEVVDVPVEDKQLTPYQRQQQAEIDRQKRELNEKQHGETVADRKKFEKDMQGEANKRIADSVAKIISNVKRQGGVISPYLEDVLTKAIPYKTVQKIATNPALQGQMRDLQRLPIGSGARERRLAALDRAYQMYLPDVAREELRASGVQLANASAAKRAKTEEQAKLTKETEIPGSRGVPSGSAVMTSSAAFDHAQGEWQKANPGKPFDKVAKESILPRVLQLMTSR